MSRDMVDTATAATEPRRGGRERKQIERFEPSRGAAGKKRRLDDEELDEDEDAEESDSAASEAEAPAASSSRKKRTANGTQKRATATEKGKKPRKKASTAAINGENGVSAGQADADGLKDDSPLFNALLNADIALNTIVEDWVETYQGSANDESAEKEAVHQLVLFVIRCCGTTVDLDEDRAMDVDGIADAVDDIEQESAKNTAAVYPLISRAKNLKPFKPNLNLFLSQLIKTLSQTPLLYHTSETTTHSTPLLPLFQSWLHNLSASALRPLRHTATYMSIKINSALCEVAADVSKDLSMKQRQREAESKKAGSGAAGQKRVKEAEKKVKEAHAMKVLLEGFLEENVDVVFVHRVRDSDAAIRTDCLKELGVWVKTYPEKFTDKSFLNYFARGCNDPDSHARAETVKALASLYTRDNFIANARSATLRLAPRLIEMALKDVDISVRVRALDVIALIGKTGILQDEEETEREQVARLVFDHEPRVRKAIGGFFKGLWDERVESLNSDLKGAVGNKKKRSKEIHEEDMAKYIGWKALAGLLVETSSAIDKPEGKGGNAESSSTAKEGQPTSVKVLTNRAAAAVEALSGGMDIFQDWEGLADYLLLDHSTNEADGWLLNEEEEGFLTHLLVACVKADESEDTEDDKTKTLINILPRLMAKNQSDVGRMTGVLALPGMMKLDMYLELRKSSAYDNLWDDLSKQFLTQTDPSLLLSAIQAINTLTQNASLSTNNTKKLTDLTESLFTSLRDALDGEDVGDLQLDEDGIKTLEGIMLRLSLLARSRDLTEGMESTEGGQSRGWDIVGEFVKRGEVGYKEESKIVEYAMQVVFLHLTWVFKRFAEEDAGESTKVEELKEKRDQAVAAFKGLALTDRSNASESVRRQAFVCFINTFVLFSTKSPAPAAKAATLKMEDEIQHKLGGSFQAAVERFASDLEEARVARGEEASAIVTADPEGVYDFLQVVSVFVAAIRTGVLEVEHAKEPLAHYGRFGPTYDAVVKKLVDVLRDEGIYNKEADTVQHVAGSALQASFDHFLDSDSTEEEPLATLSLTKLVSSAFVIHGTHFTILRQLSASDAADFHLGCIDYISKKISQLVKQERNNKSSEIKRRLASKRSRAMNGWFRILTGLLGPIGGREALRVKAHMEEMMGQTGAPFLQGKGWDTYRAFERRLVGIASKDQGVKEASRRVVDKGNATGKGKKGVDRDEEEEEESGEGSPSPTINRKAAQKGDKKKKQKKQKGKAVQEQEEEEEVEGSEENENMEVDQPEGEEEDAEVEDEADDDDPETPAGNTASSPPNENIDIDIELPDLPDLVLDLDQDSDFAEADFGAMSQGLGGPGASQRGRSESVEVDRGAKRRKMGKVI